MVSELNLEETNQPSGTSTRTVLSQTQTPMSVRNPRNNRLALKNLEVRNHANGLHISPVSHLIVNTALSRTIYRCNYFVQTPTRRRNVNLCRVSLRGYNKVTDLTLEYLAHLKLDLLDLTYTSVTKAGIERFLNLNPDCRIIHPSCCVCKPRNPF